ncbi:hypothetical protein HK096_008394 [Nowakowskiella sp. JEL0078]|nr:hypothetical protein HK096_008394 [Nowakowskiella sp. JEL0078]
MDYSFKPVLAVDEDPFTSSRISNPFDDNHRLSMDSMKKPSENKAALSESPTTLQQSPTSPALKFIAGSNEENEILTLIERTSEKNEKKELDLKLFFSRVRDLRRNSDPKVYSDWIEVNRKSTKLKKNKSKLLGGVFRAFSNQIADHIEITKTDQHVSEREIPPPPLNLDKSDFLGLAIHYHNESQLVISAFYLRQSAEQDNHPVGHFLYGMSLLHGWSGIQSDPKSAFSHFVRSAEAAVLKLYKFRGENIMDMSPKNFNSKNRRGSFPNSDNMTKSPTGSGLNSEFLKIFDNETLRELNEESLLIFQSVLALPIYQIAMLFRHGWGVPKCTTASIYYLKVAAGMFIHVDLPWRYRRMH